MKETWIQLLSWEDPLDKGMAGHSRISACRIYGQRAWRVMVHGVAESDITERLTLNTYSVLSGSKGCQQQRIHTSSAPHPAVS